MPGHDSDGSVGGDSAVGLGSRDAVPDWPGPSYNRYAAALRSGGSWSGPASPVAAQSQGLGWSATKPGGRSSVRAYGTSSRGSSSSTRRVSIACFPRATLISASSRTRSASATLEPALSRRPRPESAKAAGTWWSHPQPAVPVRAQVQLGAVPVGGGQCPDEVEQ